MGVVGHLVAVTLTVDAASGSEAVHMAVRIVERALPAIPATIEIAKVITL